MESDIVAEQLRRKLDLVLAAANMGIWSLDLATDRITWSKEVADILNVHSFAGDRKAWRELIHPDDLDRVSRHFSETMKGREPFFEEFRIIRPDGQVRWIANYATVERSDDGTPARVTGTIQDITDRKRTERAVASHNRILRLIAEAAPLERILEAIVRLVEDQLPGTLCAILTVDEPAKKLQFGAAPSMPVAYREAMNGRTIDGEGGPCCQAVFLRRIVAVEDIAEIMKGHPARELALANGLRSCIAFPVFARGKAAEQSRDAAIGSFSLFRREPGTFAPATYQVLASATSPSSALDAEALGTEGADGAERGASMISREPIYIEAVHLAGVAIGRANAERALRESEARFRNVLDSCPAAVYLKDLDGTHLFVNRRTSDLFGVPLAAWVGRKSRDLLSPPIADLCEKSKHRVLKTLSYTHQEITGRLFDGRDATVIATHFPLFQQDGRPYAICGILTDITELVATRKELTRLWTHAADPFCIAGVDGYLKQVNPAWTHRLGWTEEELLGRPYAELIHPDDLKSLAEVRAKLARGETIRDYENRYRCRDGSYRWLSWNGIPIPEAGLIYGIARDVTEEKRLAEQFHQAQKMEAIGQLASGLAHDFNNFLTVINGYADLLLPGLPEDDPWRDPLTQIRTAGKRAADLVSQLLSFSRRAIVEPRILNVNAVINGSAGMLQRLVGPDVKLEMSLTEVPCARIDAGQLDQVFLNLAVNARDAMPDGGKLVISTDTVVAPAAMQTATGEIRPGRYVRVSVRDSGTGMLPEVQARIFEPFFTTKKAGKGTGLGLATVYGIVRQAGGAVTVDTLPGSGATFRILLPAEADACSKQDIAVPREAPLGTETLLLVEDEDSVRQITRTILEMQGYFVFDAGSAAEALELESNYLGRIDAVVTDLVMPEMGGRELAEMLQRRRPGIHVLFMSGHSSDAVVRKMVESSASHFLQKPFTPGALAQSVRDALDEKIPASL